MSSRIRIVVRALALGLLFVALCLAQAPAAAAAAEGDESSAPTEAQRIRRPAFPAPRTDFYSENSFYLERAITDTRLRALFSASTDFDFYGGLRLTGETKPEEDLPYARDTVSPLLGVQWRPFYGGVVWAEYLQRIYFDRSAYADTKGSEPDPRFGIAYFRSEKKSASKNRIVPFYEVYGESVFVTRLSGTPITTAWGRTGGWWQFASDWHLDPYAELYTQASPDIELGRTQVLLRPGARLQYSRANWLAAIQVHANVPIAGDPLPDRFQALLVAGGTL